VIEQEGPIEAARRLGRHALDRLAGKVQRHPLPREARSTGLCLGLKFAGRHDLPATEAAERILYACLAAGLSLKIGGTVVTLCPSLTIRQEQLDEALDILGRAIARLD
jgi:4-aminobutyrate aminotransferase